MTDSAWNLIGYATLTAAALVAAWGILRIARMRMTRANRRCPRCWFDMSHTEGLRCTECGRDAKKEKRLFRVRRRRWPFYAALLFMIIGDAVFRVPAIQQRGWTAAVPGTVLILWSDWYRDEYNNQQPTLWNANVATSGTESTKAQLGTELLLRGEHNEFYSWQWWLLVDHICNLDGINAPHAHGRFSHDLYRELLADARIHEHLTDDHRRKLDQQSRVRFKTRDAWPIGHTVYASFELDHWNTEVYDFTIRNLQTESIVYQTPKSDSLSLTDFGWMYGSWEHLTPIATAQENHPGFEIIINAPNRPNDHAEIRRYTIPPPFQSHGTLHDHITPVQSRTFEDMMKNHGGKLAIHEHFMNNLPSAVVEFAPTSALMRTFDDPPALALKLELLRYGQVIATKHERWLVDPIQLDLYREAIAAGLAEWDWDLWFDESVTFQGSAELRTTPRLAVYSLRLTSDPVAALQFFDSTHYWDGDITIPLFEKIPDFRNSPGIRLDFLE